MKDNSQEAFFALVRGGLWEKEVQLSQFGKVDFDEIMRLAEDQSVVGLATAGLEHVLDTKVPQENLLQFIGQSLQIEQQNKDMNKFVAKLVSKMRDAGIYTLLVKGQGVAQTYEKPLWRASGDVDLFLSEDNYQNAKNFLTPLASSVEGEYVGIKHQGMTIDNWVVELHGSLNVGLPGKINRVLDDIYVDTFNGGNVRSWDNNGTQVFMLGVENDIFYVFVHFVNHFYKGGIGLRQICDWCRLLWTYRESLDYGKLETMIKRAGLMSEWRAFYALATKYLGMPEVLGPKFQVSNNSKWGKKADKIMEFVLMSGNFGHNRDMSYFSKYPFLIRKFYSMKMRVGDLINHARIFPLDSLRFFPRIMFIGIRSAVRGEG